jgi:Leucine-rich repeat (LRR) protein
MQQDDLQMQIITEPIIVDEEEELPGLRLLELYITLFLIDCRYSLGTLEKVNLRQCCKKFKAIFDSTITYVSISRDDVFCSSSIDLMRFKCIVIGTLQTIPESFRSLDSLGRTFTAVKTLRATLPNWDPAEGFLPESIGHLKHLSHLELARPDGFPQSLSLPDSFSQLAALQYFLMGTSVDSFAPLQHCTELEHMELKLPNITAENYSVPNYIGNFPSLTFLKLAGQSTGACTLPASIGNLHTLKDLRLQIWHMENLPESFGDLGSLTYLNLSNERGLTALPASIGHLQGLKKIEITNAEDLELLPESLCTLTALKMLNIHNARRLLELPASIGDLQSLEAFLLASVAVTTLPQSIGSLAALKEFRLVTCSQLQTLPDSLLHLTGLRSLRIEHCEQLESPTVDDLLAQFKKVLTYSKRHFKILNGRIDEASDTSSQSDNSSHSSELDTDSDAEDENEDAQFMNQLMNEESD